jgi:hypothetical protein
MSKKIKITEAGLSDFFKSFFRAKSDGKESEWLFSLRSKSPELADIWKDYDDTLSKNTNFQKKLMQKYGADTRYLDDFSKKFGVK